jgi:hypothetical protein
MRILASSLRGEAAIRGSPGVHCNTFEVDVSRLEQLIDAMARLHVADVDAKAAWRRRAIAMLGSHSIPRVVDSLPTNEGSL